MEECKQCGGTWEIVVIVDGKRYVSDCEDCYAKAGIV